MTHVLIAGVLFQEEPPGECSTCSSVKSMLSVVIAHHFYVYVLSSAF